MTQYLSAIEMMKKIRKRHADSDSELPLEGNSALIVSALDTIAHMASFIEDCTASDPELNSIAVGVFCKTKDNPMAVLKYPKAANQAQRSVENIQNGSDHGLLATGTRLVSTAPIDRDYGVSAGNGEVMQNSAEDANSVGRTIAAPSIALKEVFRVPPSLAATCTSLILDASGYTLHTCSQLAVDFGSVRARFLETLVGDVMSMEKDKLEMEKGEGQDSNSMDDAERMEISYISLIPETVREKVIYVPLIDLSRCKNGLLYNVFKTEEVEMSVQKPSKNSKELNFAILCVLLQEEQISGSCYKLLKSLAEKGLSYTSSCEIRSVRKRSQCNPNTCFDMPRSNSSFFKVIHGERVIVGNGDVVPSRRYLLGDALDSRHIMVRFSAVFEVDGFEAAEAENCKNRPVEWEKDGISRVSILAEFKEEIGSAILCSSPFLPLETPITSGPMHISNAVLLCNFSPSAETASAGGDRLSFLKGRYPFKQWYENPRVKRYVPSHFRNNNIPMIMEGIASSSCIAFLWSKERIRI